MQKKCKFFVFFLAVIIVSILSFQNPDVVEKVAKAFILLVGTSW